MLFKKNRTKIEIDAISYFVYLTEIKDIFLVEFLHFIRIGTLKKYTMYHNTFCPILYSHIKLFCLKDFYNLNHLVCGIQVGMLHFFSLLLIFYPYDPGIFFFLIY